jgi:phage/plasmid-like protein (TIGR03299 family)
MNYIIKHNKSFTFSGRFFMSHNLSFDARSNQYRMFAATDRRGLPWHKLGQMVSSAQSWQDAARLAHLDYTVSKHQLKSPITGNDIDAFGMFRDDNSAFLGTVGRVYEPIQINQAFDFVDTLLEAEKGAHYESAGALGNGERFWVLARVPYTITIDGTDDKSNAFLLFESSHDGTMSATAKLCLERVVCQNTLTMALSEKGMASLKVRHSSSGTIKLEAAKKMLLGVKQTVDSIGDKLNTLAHRKTEKAINLKVMEKLFGVDWKDSARKREQVAEIARLYDSNDKNAIPEIKGTAYNLLNAITEYTDHYRGIRITQNKEGMTENQVRAEGALFGGAGETMKQKALEVILETTENCPAIGKTIFSPSPLVLPASKAVDNIMSMVA